MDYIAEPATDMSHTSDWPLPADSLRLPIPAALLEKLAVHPLSRDLYPTSLGHYRRARDHRMSRERHDEHLLIYCSEGQGLLRVREGETWREYRVGSGDLLWLPPGMAHDYAADDRQPWTIFWTHLRGDSATWLQHSAGYRDTPLRHWGLQHALLGGFEQLLEVRHSGYRFQHFLLAASRLRSLLCQLPLLRRCARAAWTSTGCTPTCANTCMRASNWNAWRPSATCRSSISSVATRRSPAVRLSSTSCT